MEETIVVKKSRVSGTVYTSILWLVLGLILLVSPGESLDMLSRIIGVIVLGAGIVEIVFGVVSGASFVGRSNIVLGCIIAIVGLFIVVRPDVLVSVFPFVTGVIIIIHGVTSFLSSCQLIGAKDRYWWVGILLSLLTVGFGLLLFFRSHEAAEFTARIIGIFLVYSAASHLWIAYRKYRVNKQKAQDEAALDVESTITDVDE